MTSGSRTRTAARIISTRCWRASATSAHFFSLPNSQFSIPMTAQNQQRLGKILWAIADQLRGAMNADDFRDYMLAFLFLRYLSDNYETAAKKELGPDYPKLPAE